MASSKPRACCACIAADSVLAAARSSCRPLLCRWRMKPRRSAVVIAFALSSTTTHRRPGSMPNSSSPRLEIDPARRDHGGEQDLTGVQVEVPAVDVAVGGHGVGELLKIDRQRPSDRVMPLDPGEELGAENRVAVLVAPAEPGCSGSP